MTGFRLFELKMTKSPIGGEQCSFVELVITYIP
jgi:hypothetical protein